jgi:hypothetical protein
MGQCSTHVLHPSHISGLKIAGLPGVATLGTAYIVISSSLADPGLAIALSIHLFLVTNVASIVVDQASYAAVDRASLAFPKESILSTAAFSERMGGEGKCPIQLAGSGVETYPQGGC